MRSPALTKSMGIFFAAQERVKRTVSLFSHFASQWFPAMVDAVLDAAGPPEKGGVHYLLLDCCVTWMQWPLLFPRPPEGDAAHKLLQYLVRCSAVIPFQNVLELFWPAWRHVRGM